MSTPETINEESLRAAQVKSIQESLLKNAFQHYYQLVNFLKSLPIQQALPGMQRAYGYIDDGMVWVKEILTSTPLMLSEEKNPETKDENVSETEPVIEEKTPNDECCT